MGAIGDLRIIIRWKLVAVPKFDAIHKRKSRGVRLQRKRVILGADRRVGALDAITWRRRKLRRSGSGKDGKTAEREGKYA
jgi:hypothetical protein